MGGSVETLLADLNTFGLLFESFVARDLRVYSQPLEGRLLHYRDSAGTEVDAIVAEGRVRVARNRGEPIPEGWIVDAEGQTLGRLASRVAAILRGKRGGEKNGRE